MADFDSMKAMLCHYEDKIKHLVLVNTQQEKFVVEAKQYYHHFLRVRKEYAAKKELARASLDTIIAERYKTLTNGPFLHGVFDFYGIGIRLQGHERTKIAKSIVFQSYEGERELNLERIKQLEDEVDMLADMLTDSRDLEAQARKDLDSEILAREQAERRFRDQIIALE